MASGLVPKTVRTFTTTTPAFLSASLMARA